MSTDIGLNMEIAKTNHAPGAPKSLARFFGENNLFVKSKESHKHVRNLTSQFLGSQGLRLRMIQDIDSLARTHTELGAKNGGLDIKETSSKVKRSRPFGAVCKITSTRLVKMDHHML